jgi:hypothetical protein
MVRPLGLPAIRRQTERWLGGQGAKCIGAPAMHWIGMLRSNRDVLAPASNQRALRPQQNLYFLPLLQGHGP